MPKFGKRSLALLQQAHPDLVRVASEAIKIYDFAVIASYRGRDEQDYLFNAGLSQLEYPHSKHNCRPSHAIDCVPYPIDWEDRERFHYMAGLFFGIASGLGIKIRWGGDFNMNGDFRDGKFIDLPHFELV